MKHKRLNKYKDAKAMKGVCNGGILGQLKTMGTIPYSDTSSSITVEDIRQWKEELDKVIPTRINFSDPIIRGDKVYFNGPSMYGSCSKKLWDELVLAQINKTNTA